MGGCGSRRQRGKGRGWFLNEHREYLSFEPPATSRTPTTVVPKCNGNVECLPWLGKYGILPGTHLSRSLLSLPRLDIQSLTMTKSCWGTYRHIREVEQSPRFVMGLHFTGTPGVSTQIYRSNQTTLPLRSNTLLHHYQAPPIRSTGTRSYRSSNSFC